ncbi:hypothetical protein JCGZ_10851 [Jatropha curcas]|uniref:Aminotransferase-like plant mobile domain-containing protein n=1 Tax=Jatropha curcas TaxID=180498 RepID=A0A067KKB9_JATCU|nr:hypothetical protein JCGZ_10851 [Jatropha curcas]
MGLGGAGVAKLADRQGWPAAGLGWPEVDNGQGRPTKVGQRPKSASWRWPAVSRGGHRPDLASSYCTAVLRHPTWSIKLRGGRTLLSSLIIDFFTSRPIQDLLRPSGLGGMLVISPENFCNRGLIGALAERWWDLTNTFHFPCGELSCTSLDFTALTDVYFGGENLEFYDDGRLLGGLCVEQLIGMVPPLTDLYVSRWCTCAIGVLLICSLTYHNHRDEVDLNFLKSFEDLSSLGSGLSLGGSHFLWEAWAYEHLPFTQPVLKVSRLDWFHMHPDGEKLM